MEAIPRHSSGLIADLHPRRRAGRLVALATIPLLITAGMTPAFAAGLDDAAAAGEAAGVVDEGVEVAEVAPEAAAEEAPVDVAIEEASADTVEEAVEAVADSAPAIDVEEAAPAVALTSVETASISIHRVCAFDDPRDPIASEVIATVTWEGDITAEFNIYEDGEDSGHGFSLREGENLGLYSPSYSNFTRFGWTEGDRVITAEFIRHDGVILASAEETFAPCVAPGDEGEATVITPEAPIYDQNEPSIIIETVEGVVYQVEGETISDTYPLTPGATTVVTAIAAEGFQLAEGDWTWTYSPLPAAVPPTILTVLHFCESDTFWFTWDDDGVGHYPLVSDYYGPGSDLYLVTAAEPGYALYFSTVSGTGWELGAGQTHWGDGVDAAYRVELDELECQAFVPLALTVDPSSVAQGGEVTLEVISAQGYEEIVITIGAIELGTVVADADGVATLTVDLPASLEIGEHTATATGVLSESTTTLTVQAGSTATVVTPAAPSQSGNTVTIPAVDGVAYTDGDGAVLAAGQFAVPQGGLTVTATPAEGFAFADGAITEWSFEFVDTTDPGDGGTTDPGETPSAPGETPSRPSDDGTTPSETGTTPSGTGTTGAAGGGSATAPSTTGGTAETLPSTGSDSASLIAVVSALLLIGSAALLASRRRQEV